MSQVIALAADNLLSPIILSFVLGVFASMARSDLSVPEAAAKTLSIYLLFSIGFKGGVSVAAHGVDATLLLSLLAGICLSALIPLLAFAYLRAITALSALDAAAVAAHYGSISIVTFVAATSILQSSGVDYEGYMVAVAATMEAPAILSALWLSARAVPTAGPGSEGRMDKDLFREILLNGSIVLLVGAFLIGLVTGDRGMAMIEPFVVTLFNGILCLFLLDMGLVAGRGLRSGGGALRPGPIIFGVTMPLIGASIGLGVAMLIGLSTGGVALFMALSASASYIAVPAAMRVALPEADPSIYLTLSLGVTFPFNLTLGLPLYVAIAKAATGGG